MLNSKYSLQAIQYLSEAKFFGYSQMLDAEWPEVWPVGLSPFPSKLMGKTS